MGTGIPVPPVIPEGSKAFTICVPDDPFFYGVVMGAIKQTTFKYYWSGTAEQIEAVTDRMLTMYYSYQDQEGCMDCAQVADCIENDAGTQEAIANAIRASASIQSALRDTYDEFQRGKNMPPDVTGTDLTGANPGCDLDKLYGWIIAGINEMDTNNRDSFEVFETLSNQWERISTLVAAIPGVGVLPVDEIIGYVQGLWSDDLFEAYIANDTLTYRRTLACELFCLAQANDCQLTLDMMLQYFLDRLLYSGLQTLGNIVGYLIGGTWSGTQVNDTFYLAQLLFLKFGNAFFKLVGVKPVQIMFQLGEPSDDWILLCEECPTVYCREINATNGLETFFTPAGGAGAQAAWTGTGWAYNPAILVGRITLEATFTLPTNINRMVIAMSEPTTAGDIQQVVVFSPTFATVIGSAPSSSVPVDIEIASDSYSNVLIDVEGDTNASVDPIPGEITAITFYGEGEWNDPTIGEDC